MASQNRRSIRNSQPLPIVHEDLVDGGPAAAAGSSTTPPALQSSRKHVRVSADGSTLRPGSSSAAVAGPSSSSVGTHSKAPRRSSVHGSRHSNSHDRRVRTQRRQSRQQQQQQQQPSLSSLRQSGPHITFQYSRPWIAYESGNQSTHDLEKQPSRSSDADRHGCLARHCSGRWVCFAVLILAIIAAALAVGLTVGLRHS